MDMSACKDSLECRVVEMPGQGAIVGANALVAESPKSP